MKKEIKALETYYEVAQKEYDDSQKYYDAIDNKVNIFLVASVGVPTLLINVIKIKPRLNISFILVCMGFLALMVTLVFLFNAIRVRRTTAGVKKDEFKKNCKDFGDEEVKESIANMWLESAENNFNKALEKSKNLTRAQWIFLAEMLLFIFSVFFNWRS